MKKIALFLIALCPIAALSQKTDSAPATLFRLHYVKPEDIAGLLNGLVVVRANDALKAVVLRGDPRAVAKAEEIIQKLDVPQAKTSERNVALTIYVIGATNKPAPEAAKMPENLQPVVRQLKAIFPYSSYSLLDSMLLRSREGRLVKTSGMLRDISPTSKPTASPSTYYIHYHLSPASASEAPGAIHFLSFDFNAREAVMNSDQKINVGFQTHLDLPEGKQVVVGKTDIDGGNAALFVVLSAKVE